MIRKGDAEWEKSNKDMQAHIKKHNYKGGLEGLTKKQIEEIGFD